MVERSEGKRERQRSRIDGTIATNLDCVVNKPGGGLWWGEVERW